MVSGYAHAQSIENLYAPPDSVTYIHNCHAQLGKLFDQDVLHDYCYCMSKSVNHDTMKFQDPTVLQSSKTKCQSILLETYR